MKGYHDATVMIEPGSQAHTSEPSIAERIPMTAQPATFGRPYPWHVAWRQGLLTKTHALVYRLSGGRLGTTLLGMPMLLLTTWGRRSGKLQTTSLLYLPVDDVLVLVASNGGALHHPTWWFNLQAHPEALVQIGSARGWVWAGPVSPADRRRFWPLLLQLYPPYARYQARTDRTIPLIALHPIDTELASFRRAVKGTKRRRNKMKLAHEA